MIKNFIWDFDGTIFDSYNHYTEALCRVLDKYKINYTSRKRVYNDLRVSFGYAFEKYMLSKEQIEEFRMIKNNHDMEPLTVPYAETEHILRRILKSGGKNFLYTHSNTETIEYYLKKYNLYDLFTECVTSDYGFESKPSPQGVKYLCDKHELKPDETMMIGDRELDVLSGVRAGVFGCLIRQHCEVESSAQYKVRNLKKFEEKILGIDL